MTLGDAIDFIRPAVRPPSGVWADIGAGTGLFSEALMEILEDGKVLAVDKSPHALYRIQPSGRIGFEIIDADFQKPFLLPLLDGIIMANALHYATNDPKTETTGHMAVLLNVLASLKKGSSFILIEYDTDMANPPWVPNPVSFNRFQVLCRQTGLAEPVELTRRKSVYGDNEIYLAVTSKLQS